MFFCLTSPTSPFAQPCCLLVTRATKPLLMALTVLDAPHCWQRKCMRRVALSLSKSVSTLLHPGHSTYLQTRGTRTAVTRSDGSKFPATTHCVYAWTCSCVHKHTCFALPGHSQARGGWSSEESAVNGVLYNPLLSAGIQAS